MRKKGIQGLHLSVIILIVISFIIIAFAWIFLKTSSEKSLDLFGDFTDSFTAAMCGTMGWWAKWIFGGLC